MVICAQIDNIIPVISKKNNLPFTFVKGRLRSDLVISYILLRKTDIKRYICAPTVPAAFYHFRKVNGFFLIFSAAGTMESF